MITRRRPKQSVLMTADTLGGVWTYAIELASHLAALGVRTYLATMGAPPRAEQRAEAAAVPGLCLFESSWKLEWMDSPWEDVARAGAWLIDLEERLAPDVVHLNGYCHGALPFRAPVLVVGHSCVLSWWEAVKGEPPPPTLDRYREEVTRGIRGASQVVAPTRAMLEALERHYAIEGGRVIANGRTVARGLRWSVPKEPFIFCAARAWDEAKNLGALAQAAPGLPWPVFVAGETQNPSNGVRAISTDARPVSRPPGARIIQNGITLLGGLDARGVRGWLERASIFASPARYEPFGLSALEAAAEGCALVLGDIPSLREVWGSAAIFVRPDDPLQLREALRGLAAADELRRAMAIRARRRALELTAEPMAEHYQDAYEDLVLRRDLRRAAEHYADQAGSNGWTS
jgi:glycogen synthase